MPHIYGCIDTPTIGITTTIITTIPPRCRPRAVRLTLARPQARRPHRPHHAQSGGLLGPDVAAREVGVVHASWVARVCLCLCLHLGLASTVRVRIARQGTSLGTAARLGWTFPPPLFALLPLFACRTLTGVGTRAGMGETQIEIDRRLIREKISKLKVELKNSLKSSI